MAKSAQLGALGSLAGLGKGLATGTQNAMNWDLTLREQKQKYNLSMKQLALGVKQLNEQMRQADQLNQRFYDGLKHDDLKQVRNHKAAQRLQIMADDAQMTRDDRRMTFEGEQNIINQEAMMARQKESNKPQYARLREDKRMNNVALLEKKQAAARKFIMENSSDPNDGPLSPATVDLQAERLGFGTPQEYTESLWLRFEAEDEATYKGLNAPKYSREAFENEFVGTVTANPRYQALATQKLQMGAMEAAMTKPAALASSAVLDATGGGGKLPLVRTATGDHYLGGAYGPVIDKSIDEMMKHYPTNDKGMPIEAWLSKLDSTILQMSEGAVDIGINNEHRGTLSNNERAAFEYYFEERTDVRFPISLSGFNDDTRSMFKMSMNDKSGIGIGGGPAAPEAVIPEGATPEQIKEAKANDSNRSDAIFAHKISSNDDRFIEALGAGNPSLMNEILMRQQQGLRTIGAEVDERYGGRSTLPSAVQNAIDDRLKSLSMMEEAILEYDELEAKRRKARVEDSAFRSKANQQRPSSVGTRSE